MRKTIAIAALLALGATAPTQAEAGGYPVEEYSYTYGGWPEGPFATAPYYAAPLYNHPTPPYFAYYPYGSSRRHVGYYVNKRPWARPVLRVRY